MIRLRNSLYIIALATALSACSKTKFSEASGSANLQSLSEDGSGPPIEVLVDNPDLVEVYACGGKKVAICHKGKSLCISHCAIEQHLREHDETGAQDTLGACGPDDGEEQVPRDDDDDDDYADVPSNSHGRKKH